jgi:hypothetical protein
MRTGLGVLLSSVRDNPGPLPECRIVDGVGLAWRCSWS